MNSLTKLIASISALIASLSFAWIALTITRVIPEHLAARHPLATLRVELSSEAGGFEIAHSGSLDMTHDGSVEITH